MPSSVFTAASAPQSLLTQFGFYRRFRAAKLADGGARGSAYGAAFEIRRYGSERRSVSRGFVGIGEVQVFEVVYRRTDDDRYAVFTSVIAFAAFEQILLNSACRFQPESGAAGKHYGVDKLHRLQRIQEVRFPGCGRGSSYRTAARSAFLC